MTQGKKDELRCWFESLDQPKQVDIALQCIEELIRSEFVCFYQTSKVPYWDDSLKRLDGLELGYEE